MPSRLKSGYAALPDGPDPGEFIVSGERTCQVLRAAVPLVSRPLILGDLFRLHGEHFPADGKAKTAQVLEQIHKGQLLSGFGPEATLDSLGTVSAQRW